MRSREITLLERCGEATAWDTLTAPARAIIQLPVGYGPALERRLQVIRPCISGPAERIDLNSNMGWQARLGVTLGVISKSNYDKSLFISLM